MAVVVFSFRKANNNNEIKYKNEFFKKVNVLYGIDYQYFTIM